MEILAMKKLAFTGTVILAAFLAGRSTRTSPASAQEAPANGGPTLHCADANADGVVDVSDAVFLLNYLFLGGDAPPCSEPCPVEDREPRSLSATGQTTCYDDAGRAIDCSDADFPGQDGAYQAGCPPENRFEENGDGTVTDVCTGLVWQQDTADTNGDGRITADDMVPWQQALQYCDRLVLSTDGTWTTDAEVAGNLDDVLHDDWRLPNIRELTSLADYGSTIAIDPIFSGRDTACYWSSTTVHPLPGNAWTVGFRPGCPVVDKSGLYFVRAVRSGP